MSFGAENLLLMALCKMTVVGLATLFLSWSSPTHAQDVTCYKGDDLQRIHVVIEKAAKETSCELMYWSPPNEPQRLLRTEFVRGFCAEKLQEIVAILTDDQWLCRPTTPLHNQSRQQRWQPVM